MVGSEPKGVLLLKPVSHKIFIALTDGTFLFALHGSSKSRQHQALIGCQNCFNQVPIGLVGYHTLQKGLYRKSIDNLVRTGVKNSYTPFC